MSDNDGPEPNWDQMHTLPRCAADDCRHFDGKRCKLMGFEPDEICEPAVARMSEAIGVVLANKSMPKSEIAKWLLDGIGMTREAFDQIGE